MTRPHEQGIEFQDHSAATLHGNIGSGESTDYLLNYLDDLGVRSLAIEHHYIDRHYLDEFAHYYSKSFDVPESYCKRLHFFSTHNAEELKQLFHEATAAEHDNGGVDKLQSAYLGFLVRRPLPAARVGRTVLRTYPISGRRHYEASRPYRINLGGLALGVEGLAFQHQDRGAAVCASTALWCALQRVAHITGNRSPTPHAITQAAGSPYPASEGLTDAGMAAALKKLGYMAELIMPAENRAWFRALVVASLESQLPVVLLLRKQHTTGAGKIDVGHAVTLTGFSEPPTVIEVPCSVATMKPLRMKSGSLDVVYAHDDNLGPHAHYEFLNSTEKDDEGHEELVLQRGDSRGPRPASWAVDRWSVLAALVPKPEKLRLSIASLLEHIAYVRPSLELAVHPLKLHYRAMFSTGVQVKRALLGEDADEESRRSVLFGLSLPRHVGIISAFYETTELCQFVIDVTEVDRKPGEPRVLAMIAHRVPAKSQAGIGLKAVAEIVGIPVVFRRTP